MSKQIRVYQYGGIQLSNKKEQAIDTWMNLKSIKQSEINHTQKTMYYVFPYIQNCKKRQNHGTKNR